MGTPDAVVLPPELSEMVDWEAACDEALAHLQALLKFDTTNPPGNELKAVQYVEGVLRKEGLEPKVIESEPGRANLVCRKKGAKDGGLLLTSHLDVVGVERDKWTHDPFGGEIHDGFVWGRGAVDMKGMAAFELTTFLIAHRLGLELSRDLVLAFVADEETGGSLGMGWMVEHHPELLQASYALNEVGGCAMPVGERRIYPVQVAEKGFCWMRLRAKGQPGHGSIPRDENAVLRLTQAVQELVSKPLAHRVTNATRFFFKALGRAGGFGAKTAFSGMLNPLTCSMALRAVPDVEKRNFLHAMLHDTATPTGLKSGSKANVIPSEAEATIDCRFLPGRTVDEVVRDVQRRVGRDIEVEIITTGAPVEFPTDTPLFKAIKNVVRRHDAKGRAAPYMMVGSTDAKHLTNLGMTVYGFSPLWLPDDLTFSELFHAHDERVPVEGFRDGFKMFLDLVLSFCV